MCGMRRHQNYRAREFYIPFSITIYRLIKYNKLIVSFFLSLYAMPSEWCLNKGKVIESSHHKHCEQCHCSALIECNWTICFFFIERNLLYATQATFRLYNIKINLYIIVHSIFITEFYLLMHGMNDMEETLVVYALCSQYAIYSDR